MQTIADANDQAPRTSSSGDHTGAGDAAAIVREAGAASHRFDNDFVVTPAHKEQFARDGFVKLEGFFNASVVAMLFDRIGVGSTRGTIDAPPRRGGVPFSRVAHNLEYAETDVFELLERPYFRRALTGLTERDLFLIFDLSFEIEKNVNSGLPWHAGVSTFGLHFGEDFGCTLWAPLHPIDTSGQRGGMACVPLHVLPGDFVYPAELALVEVLKARERAGTKVSMQDYLALREEILNFPLMDEICDVHKVEYDFEPGDVLVFNKTVVHRSIMLGEGELPGRAAYVLRFVDADSRYDLNRARTLHYPVEQYGEGLFPYRQLTREYLDIEEAGARDGDLISQCAHFSDRARRTLRSTPDQTVDGPRPRPPSGAPTPPHNPDGGPHMPAPILEA